MHFETRKPTILQLGFREEALPQLKAYIDLLWSSNEELNLISRKMTFEELLDNHIIDCLLPLSEFPKNLKSAADFGSGGGLPAVIYAIQFPQMRYHLYEKSPKKQEFLAKCKSIAPNLEIHGEIPKDFGGVEVVTARGFKPIDVILDVSRQYYNSHGKYFLLKARREKIEEEMTLAKKKFKTLNANITPLQSPVLEVERHLVTI
ncbi:MAG: 16S rRNA methyltransferase [Bdellovibrio sp. ArHS]|uniref:16S rRNA (guanine(527)-N(7))-methyltransferase RsmG n=1 Tax=Bdellovibrio sp. ArHS TaxID=1569284 RepID=UPI000583604B|nr:RsmG family class I SAM-dependent methyltransferase [Bdellovibrio sp. ArHS]KHD89039.1 MAG: 16S rRNA methyltransferase [Bdellovibrio sp. ArHS]